MLERLFPKRRLPNSLTQEAIVFVLAIFTAIVFVAILGERFYRIDNLISLVRGVSILGMLGMGMAIVVIGRGVDLAMVATFVVAVSWAFVLGRTTGSFLGGIVAAAVFCLIVGLANGLLIAYAEIPPLFTTLAMGSIVFGFGRKFFFSLDTQNAPEGAPWFDFLGHGSIRLVELGGWRLALPAPILIFAGLGACVFFLLRRTRFGQFVYAAGDNPLAARVTGIPMRMLIVGQYALTSLIAFGSGLVMASTSSGMNTRLYNSTMIYDVLLVIVLGGIGLSGGRGGVRNVVVGTVFVGIMLNGMTILNLSYTTQNLIKSVMLLIALVIDAVVNPRDEQTSQQGDI